jgi:hypothetical protein
LLIAFGLLIVGATREKRHQEDARCNNAGQRKAPYAAVLGILGLPLSSNLLGCFRAGLLFLVDALAIFG